MRRSAVVILSMLAVCCEAAPEAAEEGGLPVSGAWGSYGGWYGREMRFVILADHKWRTIGGGTFNPDAPKNTWHFWGKPNREGPILEFTVDLREEGKEFRFQDNVYSLAEGEVFVLKKDYTLVQLNEKAGKADGLRGLNRLAEIYRRYKERHAEKK